MKQKILFRSMRLPFLALTFACVFLGMSIAIARQADINILLLALALTGALLAHISVNSLNEYFDFKSGLDLTTCRTPFSGGSGALPQHPEMAGSVLTVAVAASLLLLMIGCFFAWKCGAGIILPGIIGMLLIATYTGWINKHPLICLIAPGLGFGFIMVAGTQFVLQGEYETLSWLVGVVPFLLVNNLLLLNQYPDIDADKKAGRYHFPIAYGIQNSNRVYAFFSAVTAFTIVAYVLLDYLPALSLIALAPVTLALIPLYGAIKHGKNIGCYPQYLAANVAVVILTTTLLGVSIILA